MYKLVSDENDFLVIHKNPNVSFNNEENSNGLFSKLKDDFPQYKLHAVHRLDKVTSGVLIVAKNKYFAQILSEQFRNNSVQKHYIAISNKRPKKKQGKIVGDINRARRGAWKLEKTKENSSVTQFFSFTIKDNWRLFILKPKTGKTHQLRVVMKSLGSPIIGDELYAGITSDRVYLHAYSISFIYSGQTHFFKVKPHSGDLFLSNWESISLLGHPEQLNWPN